MNGIRNIFVTVLNHAGRAFCDFSFAMFIQASLLIVLLFIIDCLIRRHVRAIFRYWIWMLVFIKLVLPPALSLPTGIGNWFGEYFVVNSDVLRSDSGNISQKDTEPVRSERIASTEFSPQQILQFQNYSRPDVTQEPVAPQVPSLPQTAASTEPSAKTESAIVADNSMTWQGGIFLIWLVGVLVLSVLLIQRIFFVQTLIAQSEPAKNRLIETLQDCTKQLGIRRNLKMKLSYNAASPAVCGLFKPVILIPANILSKISHDKFKAILLHELSHIKRADLWVNCAQTILQIFYFYNPLFWLANSIVRRIREQAVDEMVLVALGAEAKSYSNTLIDVAEMAFSRPALSLRLVGVVESKKALSERIKHILSRPIPKSAKLGILGLMIIIVTALILLPMAKGKESVQRIADSKNKEQLSEFTARLPDGVTVELLGLCKEPVEDAKWWKADGSEMPEPSFESSTRTPPMGAIPVRYTFLAKAKGAENISMKAKIYEGFGNLTNVAWDGSALCFIKYPDKAKPNHADAFEKGPIEIGITKGKWLKGRGVGDALHIPRSYSIGSSDEVVIQPPKADNAEPDKVTSIWASAISHDYEFKLVCKLKDGSTRESDKAAFQSTDTIETGGVRNSAINSFLFTFDNLTYDKIIEYELYYRKFEFVRFNNVAFKPGIKTLVQIESATKNTLVSSNIQTETGASNARIEWIYQNGKWIPLVSNQVQKEGQTGKTEWVFKDGHWVEVQAESEKDNNKDKHFAASSAEPNSVKILSDTDKQSLFSMFMTIGTSCQSIASTLDKGDLETAKKLCGPIAEISPKMQSLAKSTQFETIVTAGAKQFDLMYQMLKEGKIESAKTYLSTLVQLGNNSSQMFQQLDNAASSSKTRNVVANVSAEMAGTWFFDNPMGDDEQMAIFSDGRVVVLYSNGHKDEIHYENGVIELAEYSNAKFKLNLQENGTILQYPASQESGLAKIWRRIDTQPQTNLLRPLNAPAVKIETEKPDAQIGRQEAEEQIKNIVGSLWLAVDANDVKQVSELWYSRLLDNNDFNISGLIRNLAEERHRIENQQKQDITKIAEITIQGDRATAVTRPDGDTYIYYFVSSLDRWFLYHTGFGRIGSSWPRTQLDNNAFSEYIEAGKLLHEGMDRAKIAEKFSSIGSLYPVTDTGKICLELGTLLAEMAKEDKAFVEPKDFKQLSVQEKIDYLIFKLRDVAEQEMTIPGKCFVLRFPRTPDSAAVALREMGTVVVPAMISLLSDHRPTRSVGQSRNGGVVLRYCDIALEILADIAKPNQSATTAIFDPRTGRGTYLSNADEKTSAEIIQRVNNWWQQNKDKVDVQDVTNRNHISLEFRIAPDSVESSRNPSPLKPEEELKYRQDLRQNGPDAGRKRNDEYIWIPVRQGLDVGFLVSEDYQGKKYMLVCNRKPFILLSDEVWKIENISTISDNRGMPAISVELDEQGGELFYKLTSGNLNRSLAVIIGDIVVSAPAIRSPLRNKLMISGSFTKEEIQNMNKNLQKGP